MARIGSIAVFTTLVFALLGAAADAVSGRELTIAVIPKGTTHEFWKSIHAGAVKAAGESGTTILWKGPAREDARVHGVEAQREAAPRQAG